jgi:nicotinate phosphoribosyltransferase
MGFEIFVLAIVNELYFRRFDQAAALAEGRKRLGQDRAAARLRQASRRAPSLSSSSTSACAAAFPAPGSARWCATLAREVPQYFKGTSNVLLARDLELVPIGTMGHEYLQTFQSLRRAAARLPAAALEDWVQEYRGDLGIALTDVVGMDAFLADFDLYFAKLFDGLRHDSGDPVEWGEKALAHYAKLRIDAHTKRLVFSDGLDCRAPRAVPPLRPTACSWASASAPTSPTTWACSR